MRLSLMISMLVVLVGGCSHRYYIRSLDSEEYRFFSQRTSHGNCTVVLKDGTTCRAERIALKQDTTSWFEHAGGKLIRVPTGKIRSIRFTGRFEGFVEGTGVGLLGGAAIGAIVGFSTYVPCDGGWFCFSRGQDTAIGAIIFAVPSAIVGSIIGVARGAKSVYIPFPRDSIPGSR